MKRTAHSFLPFLYILVALGLTCFVSCCFGAAIGHFIAYSPIVPIVRKILVALGSVIILSAIALMLKVRKQKRWLRDCDSDVLALRCFTLLLITIPFACNVLATYTYCDFYFLQCSVSLLFFVTGSLVSIRAKRYRYIFYYFILFIALGGLVPPS
jgi:hypothetical protein